MKKRHGFSLIELMAAGIISGFIGVSLISIYSTANRHIFQNFRGNTVKSDVSLSMHAIRNAMAIATRIDEPALGDSGSRLVISAGVEQITGCYPISIPDPATWHLFCTVNSELYYHTGTYPANAACKCPNNCATPATLPACGTAGGTRLARYVNETLHSVFSRTAADFPTGNPLLVRVRLRSAWTPPAGLSNLQRAVDYRLDSVFSVSRSAP